MKYKIISVDFPIHHENVTNISFDGDDSFLDGDIILINPTNWYKQYVSYSSTNKPQIEQTNNSWGVMNIFDQREEEIKILLSSKKVVIVFLNSIQYFYLEHNYEEYYTYSNYSFLPDSFDWVVPYIANGIGEEISLKNGKSSFASYYNAFKDNLTYKSYLTNSLKDIKDAQVLLTTKTGNPLGFTIPINESLFVMLPSPYSRENQKKIVGVITGCCKPFLSNNIKSIAPEWVNQYSLPGVKDLDVDINKYKTQIDELIQQQNKLKEQKESLLNYRGLLYEQGTPLENIVKKAFQLMGFKVSSLNDDDMEHDIILESDEGRIIGEVEGKDNTHIDISKYSQLLRVQEEDASINGGKYSKAILIGNAYRLKEPSSRQNCFTERVVSGAKLRNFGLINTVELFKITMKLLEYPNDEEFKKNCRKKIFEQLGEEIKFD